MFILKICFVSCWCCVEFWANYWRHKNNSLLYHPEDLAICWNLISLFYLLSAVHCVSPNTLCTHLLWKCRNQPQGIITMVFMLYKIIWTEPAVS